MLSLLIALSLLQISVPAKMAWDQKTAISNGKDYKLLCNTSYVRNSNFYGPSLSLSFLHHLEYEINDSLFSEGVFNRTGYATIDKDEEGFIQIKNISINEPNHTNDFIKVNISRSTHLGKEKLRVRFSDKFYNKKVIAKHKKYYQNLDPDIKNSVKKKKLKINEVINLTIGKGETAINDIFFKVVEVEEEY